METQKYRLTEETIKWKGRRLYRIQALREFANVQRGELGGYVASEKNLEQKGDCWIDDEAKVYDNASVKEDAQVYGGAIVSRTWIDNYCEVYDLAQIFDSKLEGKVRIGSNVNLTNVAIEGDITIDCKNVEINKH